MKNRSILVLGTKIGAHFKGPGASPSWSYQNLYFPKRCKPAAPSGSFLIVTNFLIILFLNLINFLFMNLQHFVFSELLFLKKYPMTICQNHKTTTCFHDCLREKINYYSSEHWSDSNNSNTQVNIFSWINNRTE